MREDSFMCGIYSYTEVMEKAKIPFPNLSIYEIAYNGILKLLK